MEFVGKAILTNLNGIRGQGHFGPSLMEFVGKGHFGPILMVFVDNAISDQP